MEKTENPLLTKLTGMPGVVGVVEIDESGMVKTVHGDEAELLGNVLVFVEQMTNRIGESLGMDSYTESQLMGKSITVICQPSDEGSLGVILNNKARMAEITPILTALK